MGIVEYSKRGGGVRISERFCVVDALGMGASAKKKAGKEGDL